MRFTLLNQFYVPDPAPTGQFLHDVARTLAERGHQVEVVCSRGSYQGRARHPRRETIDGVAVHRVGGVGYGRGRGAARLAAWASFYALSTLRAAASALHPDLIVCLTTPPYLGLVGRFIAGVRGTAHAHWVMDLYPDVVAADGMADPDGIVLRLLRALARRQFQGARLVLAPGPFVERRLLGYVAPRTATAWVPLWGPDLGPPSASEVAELRRERGWGPEELVLMYSGNLGRGHRFAEFLEAARRLGRRGPIWTYVGGGARFPEVRAFSAAHPDARIELRPYVGPEHLRASLSSADVQLVSLSCAWQGLMAPSKLQAAFAVARPVLFVGSGDNEVARWIEESGGGWVAPEGCVESLLRAVEAAADPGERAGRGAAALAFARDHFDRRTNCARIADLMEKLGEAN